MASYSSPPSPSFIDRGEVAFSCSRSSSSSSSRAQCANLEDAMADVELDAVRALADLAGIATTMEAEDRGGRESSAEMVAADEDTSWRNKRIKSESPVRSQGRSLWNPESSKSREDFTMRGSILDEKTHIEENSEELNLSISIPGNHTAVSTSKCGRGKQNLTEAEKEARKIRRILANRESARQTIRRRQAFREELSRKVADLSLENENMKMEKELRMQEYLSLKDTNTHLKEQVAKTIEKNPSIAYRKLDLSSTTNERSCMPYFCPSWPSVFREHSISNNPSGSTRPLYVSPCAWYYPFVHEYPVSFSKYSRAHGDSYDVDDHKRREGVCSPIFSPKNNDKVHFCRGDEKIDYLPIESKRDDNKTSTRSVQERTQKDGLGVKSSEEEFDRTFKNVSSSDDKGKSHQIEASSEKIQSEPIGCPNKSMSAAEAAEARKRRKELIKLKHFHGKTFNH